MRGGVGPCPRWKVPCVGRHRDKGMQRERVGGGRGRGGGEIKVHTVRHTDEVKRVPSPRHAQPRSRKQARGEHGGPQGEKFPRKCPAGLQPQCPDPGFQEGFTQPGVWRAAKQAGAVGQTPTPCSHPTAPGHWEGSPHKIRPVPELG